MKNTTQHPIKLKWASPRVLISILQKGIKCCLPEKFGVLCADPEGGGGGGQGSGPLANHKNKGFLSNTGLDSLKDHKSFKPASNVGPSSSRQRNAI